METDQELVRRSLEDPSHYRALVDRYRDRLLRYVLRLGVTSGDAEDVLQETFLKTYLNLNEYDPQMKFASWIYRIAHNEAVSALRRSNARPQPAATEEELWTIENVADELDLARALDQRLLAARLRDALSALEVKYRDVIVLRFLEDKSYDEISDVLHVPMGTVATLLSRGKARLKEILERA